MIALSVMVQVLLTPVDIAVLTPPDCALEDAQYVTPDGWHDQDLDSIPPTTYVHPAYRLSELFSASTLSHATSVARMQCQPMHDMVYALRSEASGHLRLGTLLQRNWFRY